MERRYPKIKCALPGPKAKVILKADERYISPSYTRSYPLVIDSGDGTWVTDPDGNTFLDMTAGVAVCVLGHSNKEVIAAINKQLDKFTHMSGTDFYYKVETDLARKLCSLVPGARKKKVFFTNSGTESIEAAIKIARYSTGRQYIASCHGGFHGRTFGAMSISSSKYLHSQGFAPLLPSTIKFPYAYCYRCKFNQTPGKCNIDCLKYFEKTILFKTIHPEDIAAIVFEPIQGEGGYVVPPAKYIKRLFEIAKKYGILMIADEIQAGIGRTGKFCASENFGVEPDIVCISKGIANGLPLGAMIADARLHIWPSGAHATTFGGNPVACAASLKTLDIIKRDNILENAKKQGNYLVKLLKDLAKKYSVIGDIRGVGLMVAIELIKGTGDNSPNPNLRKKVVLNAFKKGLLLLGCGAHSIRFCPALNITRNEVKTAVEILELAIKASYKCKS